MITRIWRGWTTLSNAAAYERLLLDEIFPAIEARLSNGLRGYSVNRRATGSEMEFQTTMWFDSIEVICTFAGDDPTVAHVPEKARAILHRWDGRATHYETLVPPPDGLRLPSLETVDLATGAARPSPEGEATCP